MHPLTSCVTCNIVLMTYTPTGSDWRQCWEFLTNITACSAAANSFYLIRCQTNGEWFEISTVWAIIFRNGLVGRGGGGSLRNRSRYSPSNVSLTGGGNRSHSSKVPPTFRWRGGTKVSTGRSRGLWLASQRPDRDAAGRMWSAGHTLPRSGLGQSTLPTYCWNCRQCWKWNTNKVWLVHSRKK